jgi:GTP-binding protein LepA
MKFLTPTRGSIIYDIPLAEVITDFFDQVCIADTRYIALQFVVNAVCLRAYIK